MTAARSDDLDTLCELKCQGVKFEMTEQETGYTALHYAAQGNRMLCVEFILQNASADIQEMMGLDGKTAQDLAEENKRMYHFSSCTFFT